MSFKVGDKIYKIKENEMVDKSIMYRITFIREEDGSNWHDGFYLTIHSTIVPIHKKPVTETPEMTENYVLQHHQYGSYNILYAKLAD